jgi:hypothetical protein
MSVFKFDFNRAVQEAYRQHPKLKKTTFFTEGSTKTVILPPKQDAVFKLKSDMIRKRLENFDIGLGGTYGSYTLSRKATSGENPARKKRKSYRFIAIDKEIFSGNLAKKLFQGFSTDPEKATMGMLDHEIGHLVVKHAADKTCSLIDKETRADVYASLRALQRFGGEEAADLGFHRLNVFLDSANDIDYLTTFAVDRVIIDSQTADFISLTPKQTVALAEHYAEKYLPSNTELNRLKQDFSALTTDFTLGKISEITLAAPVDSLTFYIGARALNAKMRLHEDHLFKGADAKKWQAIRTTLQERMTQSIHGETLRYFADTAAGMVTPSAPMKKPAVGHTIPQTKRQGV